MSDVRLERIENHLAQLIEMVALNKRSIDGLGQRIDGLEKRMDRLEQRMDGLEQRMDRLEQRMDNIELRMDKIEQRMDKIELRMDNIEQHMDAESALNTKRHLEILQQFRHVNADISYLDEKVHQHEQVLKSKAAANP